MKIGYVLPTITPCGGIRIIFDHCSELVKRGHQAYVVALAGATQITWYPMNFSLISAAVAKTVDFDVMVASSWSTFGYVKVAPNAKRKFYFVQMRESYFFSGDPVSYKAAEATYRDYSIRPFTICKWGKDFLEQLGHKDVPLIMNGVNQDLFYLDPQYPKAPVHDRITILCEGHQGNTAKDYVGYTWEIPLELRKKYPNLYLTGYSAFNHRYQSAFDKWYLSPTTEMMRKLYNQADILVKASAFDFLACAPVEAMCCGTPTVRALDEGDDDLIDGYNCLRTNYMDREGFAERIERLIVDARLRNELARNGLDYAKERLQWADKIDQLENVYKG